MSDDRLIFDTARRTLAIEAETLSGLRHAVDDTFCAVVRALHGAGGRVVVTGIGKSALVGQKVAATFNSTGTPALFMHAADAIHGDLGMIQAGDHVLALSRSGETAELRALVPLLRRLGHPLTAVVASAESFLAQRADFAIVTPVRREADPHDLAPTASALAQMAIGDALASALLALRGFSARDFAAFHPGGALGKQLYLTLADLACRNECPRVAPDAPLHAVVVEMTGKRLGATAVVDAADRLVGLVTDGDLRRALARGVEAIRLTAAELMTPEPTALPPDTLAAEGLAVLRERNFNHLLLADAEGGYVGIVHLHDFVREGLV